MQGEVILHMEHIQLSQKFGKMEIFQPCSPYFREFFLIPIEISKRLDSSVSELAMGLT